MPQPENRIAAIPLDPPPLNITDVWVEDEGNRLLGTVKLFGMNFHAEFLRVGVFGECQMGVGSGGCHDVFEKLMAFDDDGAFQTFQLPGFDGDWVLVIAPYKE